MLAREARENMEREGKERERGREGKKEEGGGEGKVDIKGPGRLGRLGLVPRLPTEIKAKACMVKCGLD